MTNLTIVGYKGRMGQALLGCAASNGELQIVGKIDQGDDLEPALIRADVVIDFSFHDVTRSVAQICAEQRKPLVIGTTGHSETEKAQIRKIVSRIPVVWASNYSTGVNTLFWLSRKAAQILGPASNLKIIEMHNHTKKDQPSRTAATLDEILDQVRDQHLKAVIRHGRHGIVRERTTTEIGMHSLRGGDVVGDHTVIFAAAGERLELTHKASSRETFATGALRAAQWVLKQKPGLYDMQDVLGLK